MPEQFAFHTVQNRLRIGGSFRSKDVRRVLAAAHNLVKTSGYSDLEFDFSDCTAAFSGPMLAVAAISERYLTEGVDVDLVLPKDNHTARLFLITNWANLIDPRRYEPSSYRGTTQIPAIRYSSSDQQTSAVNQIINKVLSALQNFDRSHLKAIEWSLQEITDNVLNHAESPIGGLVQVTNFSYRRQAIEFSVCDAGIGIPSSLRG
jgi:hypothetical protein